MKTVAPHPFTTSDTHRHDDPYSPRSCDRCGLPETRADVHTLPPTPAAIIQAEQRKLGETEDQ
jgi:hypothetical protein